MSPSDDEIEVVLESTWRNQGGPSFRTGGSHARSFSNPVPASPHKCDPCYVILDLDTFKNPAHLRKADEKLCGPLAGDSLGFVKEIDLTRNSQSQVQNGMSSPSSLSRVVLAHNAAFSSLASQDPIFLDQNTGFSSSLTPDIVLLDQGSIYSPVLTQETAVPDRNAGHSPDLTPHGDLFAQNATGSTADPFQDAVLAGQNRGLCSFCRTRAIDPKNRQIDKSSSSLSEGTVLKERNKEGGFSVSENVRRSLRRRLFHPNLLDQTWKSCSNSSLKSRPEKRGDSGSVPIIELSPESSRNPAPHQLCLENRAVGNSLPKSTSSEGAVDLRLKSGPTNDGGCTSVIELSPETPQSSSRCPESKSALANSSDGPGTSKQAVESGTNMQESNTAESVRESGSEVPLKVGGNNRKRRRPDQLSTLFQHMLVHSEGSVPLGANPRKGISWQGRTVGYACGICKPRLEFSSTDQLQSHVAMNHPNLETGCAQCRRKFVSFEAFKLHVPNCIKSKIESNPGPSRFEIPQEVVRCQHCDAVFETLRAFDLHMNETHQQVSQIVCVSCGMRFQDLRSLSLHEFSVHSVLSPQVLPDIPRSPAGFGERGKLEGLPLKVIDKLRLKDLPLRHYDEGMNVIPADVTDNVKDRFYTAELQNALFCSDPRGPGSPTVPLAYFPPIRAAPKKPIKKERGMDLTLSVQKLVAINGLESPFLEKFRLIEAKPDGTLCFTTKKHVSNKLKAFLTELQKAPIKNLPPIPACYQDCPTGMESQVGVAKSEQISRSIRYLRAITTQLGTNLETAQPVQDGKDPAVTCTVELESDAASTTETDQLMTVVAQQEEQPASKVMISLSVIDEDSSKVASSKRPSSTATREVASSEDGDCLVADSNAGVPIITKLREPRGILCEYCDKHFYTQKTYQSHILTH